MYMYMRDFFENCDLKLQNYNFPGKWLYVYRINYYYMGINKQEQH